MPKKKKAEKENDPLSLALAKVKSLSQAHEAFLDAKQQQQEAAQSLEQLQKTRPAAEAALARFEATRVNLNRVMKAGQLLNAQLTELTIERDRLQDDYYAEQHAVGENNKHKQAEVQMTALVKAKLPEEVTEKQIADALASVESLRKEQLCADLTREAQAYLAMSQYAESQAALLRNTSQEVAVVTSSTQGDSSEY